jgi:EmrB/QacA subfamily drug resistance transporter
MSERMKRLTLVACILGSSIALLDSTVVNVALPAMSRDLGGGLAGQQWMTGAYLLTLGSLILIGGSLGDLLGERRIYALGVAGFGATSLLCALAPTIELLVAGRALQGVAGALLTPSALAVIVATFSAQERGPAIGTWTAWGGIATVLGPLAGGWLITVTSWRWIFLLNLPLVAVTLALIFYAIPAPSGPRPQRHVDVRGAVLCALGLAGPVFALIEQPVLGWGSAAVSVPLVAGLGLLAGFVWLERRSPDPMLPLRLFAGRNFAVGNLQTLAMYAGLSILFFFLVLFLQQVAGYTPLEAGVATLPVTVVMFGLSRRFGALADRLGPRFFMGLGPLVSAAGLLLFLRLGERVSYATDVLPAVLVFALGLSMTVAPLTAAVLAGIEQRDAGIGSAVNNAVARVAGLVATAAIGAVVTAHFAAALDARLGPAATAQTRAAVARVKRQPLGRPSVAGLPREQGRRLSDAAAAASVSSFHLGLGIAAALVAAGGVLGGVGIVNPRREVAAAECAGGQFVGAAKDAAGCANDSRGPAVATPEPAVSG